MSKFKKLFLFVFVFVFALGLSVKLHADNPNEISESVQVSNPEVEGDKKLDTENESLEANEGSKEEVKEEKKEETKRVENKKISSFKNEKAVTKSGVITDEQGILDAISNKESVIEIEGGSTITLTNVLTIKTGDIPVLSFKSSNDKTVTLINANNKRHIETTGAGSISLSFKDVVLSGDGNTKLNGGIRLSNTGVGNVVDGLLLKDGIVDQSYSGLLETKVSNSSLELKNSTFTNNKISQRSALGASILYFDTVKTDYKINNVAITNNSTQNQNGAIITMFNDGGKTDVEKLTLSSNLAKSSTAGIKYYAYNGATLKVNNSIFDSNNNSEGTSGAMIIRHSTNSTSSISNTDFTNNYGDRGGGAIYYKAEQTGASLTIDNVKFISNKSSRIQYDESTGSQTGLPSTGGAFYVEQTTDGTSDLIIKNSTFDKNEATTAGAFGIMNSRDGQTKVTIDNTNFTNNIADYQAGAIDFNYQNNVDVNNLYSITNSKITNNTVTGKDTGPGYNAGGEGGGIHFYDLDKSPNLLLLDTVEFKDNSSKYPHVWNFVSDSSDPLSVGHKNNVKNTTYSKSSVDYIEKYNNAYNGDDVYIKNDAVVSFDLNPDSITDLNVTNYSKNNISYNSIKNSKIMAPTSPVSQDYSFVGWFDQNDNEWNFDSQTQPNSTLLLHAKWTKNINYTVNFDLNGAKKEDNPSITNKVVAENSLVANPGTPVFGDGVHFAGWYTKANNQYQKKWNFNSDLVTSNMTLYARWQVNINYLVDNKEHASYPKQTIDRSQTFKSVQPDNKFTWYYDKALTKKVDVNKPINKDTTLYASEKTKVVDLPIAKSGSDLLLVGGIILLISIVLYSGYVLRKSDLY